MLSSAFVEREIHNLKALGAQLHKEATFAKSFIEKAESEENVKSWFRQVRAITIYGTFLIQNLLDNFSKYHERQEEQIGFYIGKIAIQSFLDIINAFELSTNSLIQDSVELQRMLNDRIEKSTRIIEESWKSEVSRKSRDMKRDLIRQVTKKKMKWVLFEKPWLKIKLSMI